MIFNKRGDNEPFVATFVLDNAGLADLEEFQQVFRMYFFFAFCFFNLNSMVVGVKSFCLRANCRVRVSNS